MNSFDIKSSQGVYSVEFLPDLAALAAALQGMPRGLLVVDANVVRSFPAWAAEVRGLMPLYEIEASEDEKTLEGCARLLTFMQRQNANRQTIVVAVGGGVVQDIVTLCTHLYYRGVAWHYFPTTLLGMADSCIGAKASINFNGFKNQLGVFHSPSRVGICPGFLSTLPEKELRSGWGEIIKLHLAGSRVHFVRAAAVLDQEGWSGPALGELIFASLQVKKAVIEVDEFDNGIRRTLNYGHTFGHALEAVTDHAIPHGLAIVWGMDLVNFIAWQSGVLAESDFREIHSVFARHFAWRLPRAVSGKELLDATRRDKKVRDGKLNLVLLREIGRLVIEPRAFDEDLALQLSAYLAKHSIVAW